MPISKVETEGVRAVEEPTSLHESGSATVPELVEIDLDNVDSKRITHKNNSGRGEDCAERGTIGELYLAMHLLDLGYEPFFPLPGRNAKYDMLAVHQATGKVCKIQVKSHSSNKSRWSRGGYSANQIIAEVLFLDTTR